MYATWLCFCSRTHKSHWLLLASFVVHPSFINGLHLLITQSKNIPKAVHFLCKFLEHNQQITIKLSWAHKHCKQFTRHHYFRPICIGFTQKLQYQLNVYACRCYHDTESTAVMHTYMKNLTTVTCMYIT